MLHVTHLLHIFGVRLMELLLADAFPFLVDAQKNQEDLNVRSDEHVHQQMYAKVKIIFR